MTETIERNGRTYVITDGVIRVEGIPEIRSFRPPVPASEAPKPILAKFEEKGIDLSGRVWYGGYMVLAEVAEAAERQRKAVQEQAERDLLAAVPGLRELETAINDTLRYREEFSRMMEDEGNDGARPPRPVKVDADELREHYPVAAAYLKAESWSCADHDVKAAAGKRAMEAIRSGVDYRQAVAAMETEWSEWTAGHVD